MLHDLESAAQDAAEPLEWSSSGVVTILAAIKEGWPVVEMTVSPRTWTVDKQPRVATMLPRQSSQPALTRDRLVYAATTLRTSMWTLRVKQDGTTAEAARLTRSCPGDFCLPSLTAGGRDMAYTSYHARWTIHASDRNGQRDRTLPSPADPPPWIAVDAEARHIFIPEAVGKTRGRILRQPFDGGAAEPICESCLFPWDVSPDGKFLLTMSDGAVSSVGIAKLPARKDVPYLVHPKWNLYRARFSADGRWVLFYGRTSPDMSKVMAARFDPDRQPPPEEWVSITDDGSFNGPAGWSAKGNRVYFVSYRDGYRCLWTQAVDAVTKKPRGTPRAVAHFHSAARNLKNVPRGLFGFSVSGDWIAYELGELSGKIYSTRRW